MVAYSFQGRFIKPIRVGLSRVSLSFDCPPKRQTIRAVGKRRHARPGEELQLYFAQRSPQCKFIGRAMCTAISTILIKVGTDADLQFRIDGKNLPDSKAENFAREDGFGSVEDMWLFWREEHPDVRNFSGFLIKWAPK